MDAAYPDQVATNSREIGELTLALAAEIRVQRALRRWTQAELAEKSGVPAQTISKIEKGAGAIDAEQIGRIAKALTMRPDDFVTTAVTNAEERRRQGNVYLPDGTVDPAAGTTTATSDERRAALRARKAQSSE